jgi:hypothetical protein
MAWSFIRVTFATRLGLIGAFLLSDKTKLGLPHSKGKSPLTHANTHRIYGEIL